MQTIIQNTLSFMQISKIFWMVVFIYNHCKKFVLIKFLIKFFSILGIFIDNNHKDIYKMKTSSK